METKKQIVIGLIQIADSFKKDIDSLLYRRFGITLAQYKIISILQDYGSGMDQKTIASLCKQSEAAVSRQIAILHNQGLIRIKTLDNNKKTHNVIFSEKGVMISEEASKIIEEMATIRMRNFSSAEAQALFRLLQKF